MKKFVFFITLFLLVCVRVSADTMALSSERFDDTYVYYYDSNLGRTRYLEASKYSFGGNVAYCLEIGKYISSVIYQPAANFDGININDDDLEYIKIIGYYGYDYPGHHTDRFYMAAQELIWVRLIRTNIKWTTGFNPDVFANLSKEKEEIYNLYRSHYKKPSFDNEKIEVVLGKETVLEDSNNVLSMYVSNSNDVLIEGNKLIIKNTFKGNEIVLKRPIYTNKNFILYSSGNSQKMMSSGGIEIPCSNLKVKLVGGSLKIKKLDKDTGSDITSGEATLNGAEYELFDSSNKLVDTLIIGKKEKIDNLPLGKYYLRESKASNGYLLDLNTYEFEVTEDNLDINLAVYEDVIKRKVDIFKVYASNETGILTGEPNIDFEIYNRKGECISKITTDQDGYASIVLPYGIYTFKQINSTENYYKVDDFTVTISEYDERPIYKLISNSEIKAKVKVIKKDVDTGENIINSKIKFKIFDVKKNEFVSFKLSYPEDNTISEFEITKDGTFVTPLELSSGEYILYEVDNNMDGYLYNKNGVKFTIGENANLINDEAYGIIVEVPFYNKVVKGKIIINKYGEDIIYKNNSYYYKKIYLDDTYFDVHAKEDIYENGKLIYSKGDLVGEIITDDGGEGVLDNLPLGKYYLKETKSNNGNVIDSNIYDIELNYKDQYTEEIVYELDVYNYFEKGKLTINKFKSNSNIRLANTLIEIRNMDNEVIYKGYTDSNGQIVIEDLLYGEYYISEVEASTGYRILEDKIYFKLDSDNLNIDIYNERIEVPNTGIDVGLINIVFLFIIIFGIVLIILFWENKRIMILSGVVIMFGILYLGIYFYRYYSDCSRNKKSVEAFFNNEIDNNYDEKYRYKGVLSIPSIGLERGILEIDNEYNDAKYNIELVSENEDTIILASHNGNNYNSYFGNLSKLELGEDINYYYNNKIYKYIYSDSYVIKKNGYADIYCKKDQSSIILITCLDGNDDAQIVHIGYLKEVSPYEKG